MFDVVPLLQTSLNKDLRLSESEAQTLNIAKLTPQSEARLTLAVGGDESTEFHRQSAELARAWTAVSPQLLDVSGFNHFTIVDSLSEKQGVLHRLAYDMLSS